MDGIGRERRQRSRVWEHWALASLVAVATVVITGVNAGQPTVPSLSAAASQASPIAAAADEIQVAARELEPPPPNATAIYVVGGLSRSRDGGRTWESAGPPPPPGRIVAADDDPLLLLAGSRPPCGRADPNLPMLQRSTDGGATWTPVEGGAGIAPLAILSDAQVALGASCAGLLISADAGQSWPELPSTDPPLMESGYEVSAFTIISGTDPAGRAALAVGTSEGGTSQLRRLDLANPAQPMASDSLMTFWGGASLAAQTTDQGELYVIGTANGVLVSPDGGVTWNQSRQGLEDVTLSVDPTQGPVPDEELQRGFGISAVTIDPSQHQHLYAGTIDGLFVSVDGGATWEREPAVDGLVATLVVATESGRLLVQTTNGVVAVPLRS